MLACAAVLCGAQAKKSAAIMPNNKGGASQTNIVVSSARLLD
jgi:hypothetical protein